MRRIVQVLAMLSVLPAAAVSATNSKPIPSKLSPYLKNQMLAKEAQLSALIILKDQADIKAAREMDNRLERGKFVYEKLSMLAKDSQKDLRSFLTEKGANFQSFYVVNMIAVYDAAPGLLEDLTARNEVERIIANPLTKTLPGTLREKNAGKKDEAGIEANIVAIGADKVWSDLGVDGSGIVIAGQDTGVQWDHPALKAKYRGFGEAIDHRLSWHDAVQSVFTSGTNPCGVNTEAPCDDNDHGTHTVGTVLGDDGQGNQVGVAPGAQWVACRNMDRGLGRPSSYIECFEWFLAPYPRNGDPLSDGRPEFAPHVINNSWGCPPEEGCREAEILPVLEVMQSAGIMVVVSAGNSGSGCSTIEDPPAMHSASTFSVGAHNHRNNDIASFSSRGPSKYDGEVGPDITAPGVAIRSAVTGDRYSGASWSGTSMAGPHLVGVVALMWSANPKLIGKIDETTEILRNTAIPTTSTQTCGGIAGTEIPNNTFGYGRVNAFKAVEEAKKFGQEK